MITQLERKSFRSLAAEKALSSLASKKIIDIFHIWLLYDAHTDCSWETWSNYEHRNNFVASSNLLYKGAVPVAVSTIIMSSRVKQLHTRCRCAQQSSLEFCRERVAATCKKRRSIAKSECLLWNLGSDDNFNFNWGSILTLDITS